MFINNNYLEIKYYLLQNKSKHLNKFLKQFNFVFHCKYFVY